MPSGETTNIRDDSLFAEAVLRFEAANAQDPNQVEVNGELWPRELIYAKWLSEWVARLWPNAPEPLLLAGHCQHICRWTIPREQYPDTREGYLRWRQVLKQFHAEKAGEILSFIGYPQETLEQVKRLNLKKDFPTTEESRVLEDALCLVFLEHQLADLAARLPPEKLFSALQKAWKKMSPKGRETALSLKLPPDHMLVLQQVAQSIS